MVPLAIDLLDKMKYGIWITIYSIVTWFNMMDMGIGSGFRNMFSSAIAKNDIYLAREYIQTLYSFTFIISLFIFIVAGLNSFIPWSSILNIAQDFDENIVQIIVVINLLFAVQFFLRNIVTVLLSLQKTSMSNFLIFIGNLLCFVMIYIYSQFFRPTLFAISIVFMISPIAVNLSYTYYFFSRSGEKFGPLAFCWPSIAKLKELLSLGFIFFFIQITAIIIYSLNNLLITIWFGASEVTPYNVSYRLYSLVSIGFAIVVSPFWTAFTEAREQKDFTWIKSAINKLLKIWVLVVIGTISLFLISPILFRIWIGSEINISRNLSFQFALFSIITNWLSIFTTFLYGIGKIKLLLYITIVQVIIFLPFALIFSKLMGLGSTGLILTTNINLLIPSILLFFQTFNIINGKTNGIWNK